MKKTIVLVFIISIILVPIIITLAKYTDVIISGHSQVASEFYFDSNYLSTDERIFELYTDSINVRLYNYELDNILNITNDNIIYDTSIKYYSNNNELISEVNSTNNNTWINDEIGKYSDLVIKHVNGSSYVIVNVSSTDPYSKNISARFNFNFTDYKPMYYVNKLTNGFTIKIMTANENLNQVVVNYPVECGPDNTNPLMSTWTNGSNNNSLVNLLSNTTYSVNFYCNLEQTNVIEVNGEVLDESVISVSLE